MTLNILIVEDDLVSRIVMNGLLNPYGHCDMAVNGNEAIQAFKHALKEDQRYNLICLDIMMPEMNGQETLKKIREIEEKNGIHGLDRVKIIMITALSNKENVISAFKGECEAYIVKPVSKENLSKQLLSLGLIGEKL